MIMTRFSGVEPLTAKLHSAKHSGELQAIRGIAAFTVMLSHCMYYYNYEYNIKYVSQLAFNAHAAVVVFFVLSGYVLASSLLKTRLDVSRLISFYIRRFFRIYPALFVGIFIGITYVITFHGFAQPAIVSSWWIIEHRKFPDVLHLILAFAGISTTLPIPIWTLFIELVASALLPLYIAFIIRKDYLAWPLAVSSISVSLLFGTSLHKVPSTLGVSCLAPR